MVFFFYGLAVCSIGAQAQPELIRALNTLGSRWDRFDDFLAPVASLESTLLPTVNTDLAEVGIDPLAPNDLYNTSDPSCLRLLSNFTAECLFDPRGGFSAVLEEERSDCCALNFNINLEGCVDWCTVPESNQTLSSYILALHVQLCRLPASLLLCEGQPLGGGPSVDASVALPSLTQSSSQEEPTPLPLPSPPQSSPASTPPPMGLPMPLPAPGDVDFCPTNELVSSTLLGFCVLKSVSDLLNFTPEASRACCALTSAYYNPACFDPCSPLDPPVAELTARYWRAICFIPVARPCNATTG